MGRAAGIVVGEDTGIVGIMLASADGEMVASDDGAAVGAQAESNTNTGIIIETIKARIVIGSFN